MPLATRSPTPWKAWLSVTALGVASLASGAVGAATAIPAGPLVSTDWLARFLAGSLPLRCSSLCGQD